MSAAKTSEGLTLTVAESKVAETEDLPDLLEALALSRRLSSPMSMAEVSESGLVSGTRVAVIRTPERRKRRKRKPSARKRSFPKCKTEDESDQTPVKEASFEGVAFSLHSAARQLSLQRPHSNSDASDLYSVSKQIADDVAARKRRKGRELARTALFRKAQRERQRQRKASVAKSIQDAEGKVKPNFRRYLHKVHWMSNANGEKEAYLDWVSDESRPNRRASAIPSTMGYTRDVFGVRTMAGAISGGDTPDGKSTFSPISRFPATIAATTTSSAHSSGTNTPTTTKKKDQLRSPTMARLSTGECVQRMSSFELEEQMMAVTNNSQLMDTVSGEHLFDELERNWKYTGNAQMARSRRIVFVDMKLKRLSCIDTSQLTFRCKFHFYATWMATYEEVQAWYLWKSRRDWEKQTGGKVCQWEPEWQPNVEFTNAVDTHKVKRDIFKLKPGHANSYKLSARKRAAKEPLYGDYAWDIAVDELGCDPRDAFWIRVRYDYDITFSEELELDAFPFDCQNFSIFMTLVSETTTDADLVPFPRRGDFLLLDSRFSVLSEWKIHNVIAEWKHTDPAQSKSLTTYPLVAVHIKAARKWNAHGFHIAVTLCMQTVGLCAFAIDTDESIGERMSYCVTLLLADVALLQLLSGQLPNISYATLLDVFMWTCFGFLFLVTIWSAFIGGRQFNAKWDNYAFYVFFVMYLLSVGYFTRKGFKVRGVELSKLTKTEEELREMENSMCCFQSNKHKQLRGADAIAWDRGDILADRDPVKKNIVTKGCRSLS